MDYYILLLSYIIIYYYYIKLLYTVSGKKETKMFSVISPIKLGQL